MIESIQGAYNAIKGGLDIAQGFQALKTEAAVNQAVIEIQRSLLEAQRALNEARHTADLSRIDELKKQIMDSKDWAAEAERYEAVDIDRGSIAYMLKLGMENGQPPHWLCANCFNHGAKSFLVFKGQDRDVRGRGQESAWGCDNCRASIKVGYMRNPASCQTKRHEAAAEA